MASKAGRRQRARRRRRGATGASTIDVVDRWLLALLGLLAVVAGTVPLLERDGDLGLRAPSSLYDQARRSAIDHQEIWTAATVTAGTIVALLGLWWAWAQVRPRPERGRLRESTLRSHQDGTTTIEPAPLARALAADITRIDGVTSATARLVALGPLPEILISAQLEVDADIPRVREAMEGPLARLAASIAVDAIDAELRLRAGSTTSARVI